MSFRDIEIFEAIKRDDLSYLLATRYEKILDNLLPDDTHPFLLNNPTSLMVSAFFGSLKCFNFLFKKSNIDYRDEDKTCLIFYLNIVFILQQLEVT